MNMLDVASKLTAHKYDIISIDRKSFGCVKTIAFGSYAIFFRKLNLFSYSIVSTVFDDKMQMISSDRNVGNNKSTLGYLEAVTQYEKCKPL